ncbi:MAG: UDP-N-acetylglucosamine 1-carboxyvinyltransferase [Proteobacteria bacterium]|nr:UDP-N-acetylglucosamine 1-carboxyvinyltransferase [Pseudomonadota bacterium]
MDAIRISGGIPLHGTIPVGGAKNAALPLMAACLLTDKKMTLSNLPHLMDITTMANLLVHLGVRLSLDGCSEFDGHTGRVIEFDASGVTNTTAPYELVSKMRASVVVLGPLVARLGHAKVSLPGGCAIGPRPINLHLQALEKLGAQITLEHGYIEAKAPKGLKGAEIHFPIVSVGATENAMMAATLAEGTTVIHNAACEPEITDLGQCLNTMGAEISGLDTRTLVIKGKPSLGSTNYAVIADRIEAGTYAIAASITGGDIELTGINESIMGATFEKLLASGTEISKTETGLRFRRKGDILPLDIETAPYPLFATDMQAQFMALLCLAKGTSHLTETIFENRFMHVPELMRMGAKIDVEGNTCTIYGIKAFKDAEVMATDLRASVSLVLAALAAKGETTINRVYHIDRGYESIEEKLGACGAKIGRVRALAT